MPNVIEKETEAKKKGLSTQQTVLILGAGIIVAGAIVAYLLLRPEQTLPEGEVPAGAVVITEENVEQINRDLREKVAEGMFETHMNMEWSFPNGTAASDNALMGNSVNNNFPFYFDVTLKETDEVVFTSGLLHSQNRPGQGS